MYKSVKELAAELGVSRMTVWTWAKRLSIGGYRDQYDGRIRLFDEGQQKRLREAILKQRRVPRAD